jgi:cysteine sulfinate desulfinase/cysteine desulfurase-like protein
LKQIKGKFHSDYLTFAGDCMHTALSGALFVKPDRPFASFFHTINVPSLIALCAAAQMAHMSIDAMGLETARLRDWFESQLIECIPGACILMKDALRLPNVSLVHFPRVHPEAMLYALSRRKVFAAIGSAINAVSFALSRMTAQEELREAVRRIKDAHASLAIIAGDL